MQSSSQIITTNKPTSSCFVQDGYSSCRPTNSVKALNGKYHILWTCLPQAHLGSSNSTARTVGDKSMEIRISVTRTVIMTITENNNFRCRSAIYAYKKVFASGRLVSIRVIVSLLMPIN